MRFWSGGFNGQASIIRIYAVDAQIASGTTFTINYNNSPTRHQLSAFGVSGVANETPQTNRYTGFGFGGGSPLSLSTYAADGDLAISIITHVGSGANGDSGTASSGFTEYQDGPSNASTPFIHQYVEYQVMTTAGTVTSSPTFVSDTGNIFGVMATFRPASLGQIDQSQLFESLGQTYLTEGPTASGPFAFFEDRTISIPSAAVGGNITLTPAVAGATASALTPTLIEMLQPAVAGSTGSAVGPQVVLTIPPSVAAATASALGPTIRLVVPPAVANATASALGPQVNLIVPPGAASATGSGLNPNINLIVLPGSGSATASAPVPTILIGLFILPATASATASGLVPTLQTTVAPTVATATASTLTPALASQVLPAVATATASALAPVLATRILPPVATATGSALTPTLIVRVTPSAASAAASALVPVIVTTGIVAIVTGRFGSDPSRGYATRHSPGEYGTNPSPPGFASEPHPPGFSTDPSGGGYASEPE